MNEMNSCRVCGGIPEYHPVHKGGTIKAIEAYCKCGNSVIPTPSIQGTLDRWNECNPLDIAASAKSERAQLQNDLLRVQIETARFELERAKGEDADTDTDTKREGCESCRHGRWTVLTPCDVCRGADRWEPVANNDPYSVTLPKPGE